MADARLIPAGINDATGQAVAGLCGRFDALDLSGLLSTPVETRLDAVLDHLAWTCHVEGWEYVATRAQKIDLIKRFYEFHRYKGTKHGLALYFKTFLARDLLAASPPSKSFCGASLTDAERAAWEAGFPEIRIYPYRHDGVRQGAFVGDYAGACQPNTSDAILRIGDQVALYDPVEGVETKLDSLVTERDVESKLAAKRVTVAKPGVAGRAMFAGLYAGPFCSCDTGASERLYVLDLTVGYEDEIARRRALSVRPSLSPVKIGSDEVSSAGERGGGIFLGHRWPDGYDEAASLFAEGKSLLKTSACDRLFRRTKLYDPDREAFSRRGTSTFLGAFKLGVLRPHYPEAAVDMLRTAPARAMFCGRHAYLRYACDLDARSWVDRMRRVGRMAMRLSDRILVSTANRACVQASESLKCGQDLVCGEYQLEAL